MRSLGEHTCSATHQRDNRARGTAGQALACPQESTDSIPGLAQWLKDPVLPQPWFQSDPWPQNPICCQVAKTRVGGCGEKRTKKKKYICKQEFKCCTYILTRSKCQSKLMSQLPYSSTKYQKTITITVHEQHIIFYLNSMIIYTYSYDPSRT